MKLYKVTKWDLAIEEVEVTRVTNSSLFKPDHKGVERRESLSTTYYDHFETWQGAKNHLIAREQMKLDESKGKVTYFEQRIEKAKSLINPTL